MQSISKEKWMGLGLGTLFTLYGFAYIFSSSYLVDGHRVFSLFDDAMISMRYARNLAETGQLVWNHTAERVEGFTNPGWVFIMTLLHFLPLKSELMSLPIQLIGIVLMLGTARATFLITKLIYPEGRGAAWISTILVLGSISLINWTLQGMEVGILTFFTSLACYLGLTGSRRNYWWGVAIVCAGVTVRIDFALMAFVFIGLKYFTSKEDRMAALQGAVFVILALVLQTAARWAYFGDLLPNTYYLKMTGFPMYLRLWHGEKMFIEWIRAVWAPLFFLPLLAMVPFKKNRLWLLSPFAAQAAYSIWVGGDAWEDNGGANRYLSQALPVYFVLAAVAMEELAVKVAVRFSRPRLEIVVFSVLAVSMFCTQIPRKNNGERVWRAAMLLDRPIHTESNQELYQRGKLVALLTKFGATVGVTGGAGTVPYFWGDRIGQDMLGKCDRHISHLPMHIETSRGPGMEFYPGHLKWDYFYSIAQRQPDVVEALWHQSEEIVPELTQHYTRLPFSLNHSIYLKKNSKFVIWPEVEKIQKEAIQGRFYADKTTI